jgi:hypothetical protein
VSTVTGNRARHVASPPRALTALPDRGIGVPWTTEQVARVLVTNAAGLTVLLAGAYESSLAPNMRTAMSWLILALAGLAVAGVANGVWLTRSRHEVSSRLRDQLDALRGYAVEPSENIDVVAGVLTAPGLRRYHRPGCDLLTLRTTHPASAEEIQRAGLTACEICEP